MKKFMVILLMINFIISCTDEIKVPEIPKISDTWSFKLDVNNEGEKNEWFHSDTVGWKSVTVPSMWDSYIPENYDGFGWYKTMINWNYSTEKVGIVFEGVDDNAVVWLNGEKIGEHIGYGKRFAFDISEKLKQGANWLAVRIEDTGGPGGLHKNIHFRNFEHLDDLRKSPHATLTVSQLPEWAENAIIYEVFVRSFSPEGTFKGLQKELPRLKQLGVDILWLMPIHDIGKEKRKGTIGSPYAIRDFYSIDPSMGTKEDFAELVESTHQLDMKIIIDLVANHTSWDSELIQKYPDYFKKNEKGEIIPPVADWWDIAALNFDHPELRVYMHEMILWWIREFNIDGYRCDVAEMVPTSFWQSVIAAAQREKPTFWLAEGANSDLVAAGFHSTYGWNTMDSFLRMIKSGDLTQLKNDLDSEGFEFPKGSLRMRFTENHDKKPIRSMLSEAQSRLGAGIMYFLPGQPLIYNGMEVGNTKELSLFEKVSVQWGKNPADHVLHKTYQALGEFRKANSWMQSASWEQEILNGSTVLMVKRISSDGLKTVTGVFNFSNKVQTIPGAWSKGQISGLSSEKDQLKLPSYGFDYFVE